MAQYYQIIQSVDDIKHLNLENCVIMNEDGTQSVILSDSNQVIENNQIPQLIYQPNTQPSPIQTADGQIHYIVQEDDLQTDNFNLVPQATQQVYYQKIANENGQQIIQHHAKTPPEMQNTVEVQQPVQYQTSPSQPQYQQIVINHPQNQQVLHQQTQQAQQHHQNQQHQQNQHQQQQQVNYVIRQAPSMPNTTYVFHQPQSSPPQQLVQVQMPMQQHQQTQITSPQSMQEIQTSPQLHANRIQVQLQGQQQMIRRVVPVEQGNARPRFVHRVNTNQIQMVTPQKVMQPAGMQQQVQRFQTPVRAQANSNVRPVNTTVRTVRPRTPATIRTRTPINVRPTVNAGQQIVTSNASPMAPRARLTLARISTPNQVQPIISVGTPKTVVSITSPPRGPNMIRTQLPTISKNPVTGQLTYVQTSPSTSNMSATTEDLEDSIQAARITKQPTTIQTADGNYTIVQQNPANQQISEISDNHRIVTLQSGAQMSLTEYKQRQASQSQMKQITGVKPMNRGVQIQNRTRFASPNVVRTQRPISQTQPSPQQQPQPQQQQHQPQMINPEPPQQQYVIEKEICESARMLIVLENGEQRLITFTLPKECCTVHELLEQIGVPFKHDTNINCVAQPGLNIDYLVTVGVNLTETATEIITAAENSLQMKQQEQPIYQQNASQTVQIVENHTQQHQPKIVQKTSIQAMQQLQKVQNQVGKQNTVTVTQKTVQPKYIMGMFALCQACGYTSQNHAQCQRCYRIFTEEPKKIPMSNNVTLTQQKPKTTMATTKPMTLMEKHKKDSLEQLQKKFQFTEGLKTPVRGRIPVQRANTSITKKSKKVEEPVILTLSSDEEDDDNSNSKESDRGQTLLSFEPIYNENIQPANFIREDVLDLHDSKEKLTTKFKVQRVYLGTYKYQPTEDVIITSKGIRLVAPNCKHPLEKTVLNIQKSEILKIICNFENKCILVLYVLNTCGKYIRDSLEMSSEDEGGYFSPMSDTLGHKRIMLEGETSESVKSVIKSIFSSNTMEEISMSDTTIIKNQIRNAANSTKTNIEGTIKSENNDGVCNILIYPPTGKGGIPINTKDFICLGIDQYLNDVIIDFYLKYLHTEILTETQRAKTHIFSTFFYNTLTNTKLLGQPNDVKLTAAQKRHERVKNWTKHVNIFEKDYIIVPINQQSHWFLAIICFASLRGPVTIDSNQPVKATPTVKRKPHERKESVALQIGNTTITPVSKKELDSICLEEESDRDEAEGDESDLESDESEGETVEPQPAIQAIKQACILIFDSLAGASRSRVVATLRDYLTCEYRAKMKGGTDHAFSRYNIQGHNVKVPQQTNFTDCGLYVLQYVESFFTNPIKNYQLPIKHLNDWFDAITVTKKREDIVNLIKQKMIEENKNIILPEIQLPTENGRLLELPDFSEEHGEFEDEEDMDPDYTEQQQEASQQQQQQQQLEQPHQQQQQIITEPEQEKPTQKKRIIVRKQPNVNDNGESTTKKRRT